MPGGGYSANVTIGGAKLALTMSAEHWLSAVRSLTFYRFPQKQ
jgi:hypothetical protein